MCNRLSKYLNLIDGMKFPHCHFKVSAQSPGLSLSNNGKSVRKIVPENEHRTIYVDYAMKDDDIAYFHFQVDNLFPTKYVMIGIVNDGFVINNNCYPGINSNGMAFYCASGNKYFAGASGYSSPINGNGDEIGMIVDLKTKTLTYSLNGSMIGTAFSGKDFFPSGKTWYPAIALYTAGETVTLCDVSESDTPQ